MQEEDRMVSGRWGLLKGKDEMAYPVMRMQGMGPLTCASRPTLQYPFTLYLILTRPGQLLSAGWLLVSDDIGALDHCRLSVPSSGSHGASFAAPDFWRAFLCHPWSCAT
jgi:hypothetical protein